MDGYICDMRTRTIRERTKADFFSKTFQVHRPGSNLTCLAEMNDFIDKFSCERQELALFLKQTWAKNITQDTSSKLIYFYIGCDGDNCKSFVRKLLDGMCKDFSTSLDKDLLVGSKSSKGSATTWLQSLVKSRLSMSDELGRKDVINVEKLKEVTGDTPMSFR